MRRAAGTLGPPPAMAAAAGGSSEVQGQSTQQHSAWRSPIPYLFGGLAAMLGLIAFALLILACSYWKLSGHLDSNESAEGDSRDAGGQATANNCTPKSQQQQQQRGKGTVLERSILVIMAGEEKPTYLATPDWSWGFNSAGAVEMQERGGTGRTGERSRDERMRDGYTENL